MVSASAAEESTFHAQKTSLPSRLSLRAPLHLLSGPNRSCNRSASVQVIVEKDVAMQTRDGVTLRADIYRPAADSNYPVLLTRTPYNKDNFASFGQKGAARGFMVVVQDVRGRFTSDGEWYPSSTRSKTATTPWNGPPRCPTPTAKSACSAAPM